MNRRKPRGSSAVSIGLKNPDGRARAVAAAIRDVSQLFNSDYSTPFRLVLAIPEALNDASTSPFSFTVNTNLRHVCLNQQAIREMRRTQFTIEPRHGNWQYSATLFFRAFCAEQCLYDNQKQLSSLRSYPLHTVLQSINGYGGWTVTLLFREMLIITVLISFNFPTDCLLSTTTTTYFLF